MSGVAARVSSDSAGALDGHRVVGEETGMPQWKRSQPLGALLVGLLLVASPASAGPADLPDPVPVLPFNALFSPGPRRLGYAGIAQDPSSIGNFRGLVALAYLKGKVRDATGRRLLLRNDIRILQGDYVAADGIQRSGTFGFV
jgi:hypothetical protein